GRLENHYAGQRVVYARGEAAAAYDPALTLKRFSRQMLFIGKYVVLCDDLASREPREFAWLLQTDAPMKISDLGFKISDLNSSRDYAVLLGSTRLRVSVCEPQKFVAKNSEQEIVANPSSSTPDWVLRHTQHTLMLTPERTRATRFVVALCVEHPTAAPTRVESLACDAGSALALSDAETRAIVAFAQDTRGIKIAGEIETDARWIVANFRGDALRDFSAGEATRVVIGGQTRFESPERKSFEMDMREKS
ncbi:MAG: hypothetical protein L0Y55_17280, partial [Anaerolineales bacterium]|nr:hypothetical protein [Anaerolineales bacterium]